MAYDVLIRNGRIVDGSGMPAFHGDVGVKDGKIVELGKLSGAAGQTIDAGGRAISPGFIDNHCHYDAQVTWDPLCSFSCDHGATRLRVIAAITRCAATQVNPTTAERDLNIVTELQRGFGHNLMGVYAEVVEGGEISVGEEIKIRRT